MVTSAHLLSPAELKRYSRHLALPNFGLAGQLKLKQAKVLCVGAGGLGSPLLLYLTAAGVGTIGIIDADVVTVSNLQRQILYSTKEVGIAKATVAQIKLTALNPEVQIISYQQRLTQENAVDIISQYDVVADGTDNYAARYLINDNCFRLHKPNVYASVFQFEGQCSVFNALNGPCYRCLYSEPPPQGLIPNCAVGGVMGVLPGVMGAIQATEVIKLITAIGTPLVGRLLIYNALNMQFHEVAVKSNPECWLCHYHESCDAFSAHEESCAVTTTDSEITVSELRSHLDQGLDVFILDVREPNEYQTHNIGGYLIPLGELSSRLDELDRAKTIVVHCHAGNRSKAAVKILQQYGFVDVKSLAGGIIAWYDDPSY